MSCGLVFPLIGFFTFISLLIPDLFSAVTDRPVGRISIPGGAGLLDGLFLKPFIAMGVTWLAYYAKTVPVLQNRRRHDHCVYSAASTQFLFNLTPNYTRPKSFDGFLIKETPKIG